MGVLFFGTYDARRHPRVRILAEGLRRQGFDITECNVPLDIDIAGRVEILQRPWMLPYLIVKLARCWYPLVRAARAMPRPDAVVVGYVGHLDVVLARVLFRSTPILFDQVSFAADRAGIRARAGWLARTLLQVVDQLAMRSADVIIVAGDRHREAVPARYRDRTLVMHVTAAEEWFEAGREPDDLTAGTLRVIFAGAFTPRQGALVVGRALSELAGEPIEVTMVGHGRDHAETRALARVNERVTWLDWVSPDELPKLVADHDICLGVFGTTPEPIDVLPTKLFQAAAAGCAVVTAGPIALGTQLAGAVVVVPPDNSGALASALRRLLPDPVRLGKLRAAARLLAQDRFAPAQMTRPLGDQLRELTTRPGQPTRQGRTDVGRGRAYVRRLRQSARRRPAEPSASTPRRRRRRRDRRRS